MRFNPESRLGTGVNIKVHMLRQGCRRKHTQDCIFMKTSLLLAVALLGAATFSNAQSSQDEPLPSDWTLQTTIAYARAHNLDVRSQEVATRGAKDFLRQSQLGQIPHLSFNTNYGQSFGTNIDPATNAYTREGYNYFTFTGTASVLVFGWMQQRNTILKNKASLKASEADLAHARDVATWTVTVAFLRVLLNWEQMKINERQVQTTQAQIGQATKFVKAGVLPDLSLAQLQAQLAGDSALLIKSTSEVAAAVVDIKALLSLPQNAGFNVTPPDADALVRDNITLADPETIYGLAEKRMGSVLSSNYKVEAARLGLAAAKGANLPQLSMNASVGTAYSTSVLNRSVTGFSEAQVPNTFVTGTDGTRMPLYTLSPIYDQQTAPFTNQIRDLFRNTYFLNLTLPLFNGWSGSYNVRASKLALEEQELNQVKVRQALRQEVYKAHNDARNAIQTYIAARRATEATDRALKYAQARLFAGMTNVTDYLNIFNTTYISQSRLLSAKYDMFFKMKLVDFYMGRELAL
jgi:outer membrane protein